MSWFSKSVKDEELNLVRTKVYRGTTRNVRSSELVSLGFGPVHNELKARSSMIMERKRTTRKSNLTIPLKNRIHKIFCDFAIILFWFLSSSLRTSSLLRTVLMCSSFSKLSKPWRRTSKSWNVNSLKKMLSQTFSDWRRKFSQFTICPLEDSVFRHGRLLMLFV